MRMRSFLVVPFACVAACAPRAGWTAAPATLSAAQQAQVARAETARDGLAKALLGELQDAIGKGAPAAIAVCSERAPVLAKEKAAAAGVKLGRTSKSLRNPANGAPEWAAGHVAAGAPVPAFFTGPGGALGALYPIKLQAQCVVCHGKPGELAPGVADELGKRYPQDHATGFAVGDLRGWFWVEVPGS